MKLHLFSPSISLSVFTICVGLLLVQLKRERQQRQYLEWRVELLESRTYEDLKLLVGDSTREIQILDSLEIKVAQIDTFYHIKPVYNEYHNESN